jgi:large subunit ribosomal protein L13
MRVIDAEGAILGRLASSVAKELLKGERITLANAEKAVITGTKRSLYRKYKQRVDRADISNPRKGPKFPRRPDLLVRRTVRGMLPYKTERGDKAMKNLRVYMGVPPDFKEADLEKIAETGMRESFTGEYTSVMELSVYLGYRAKENPEKEALEDVGEEEKSGKEEAQ